MRHLDLNYLAHISEKEFKYLYKDSIILSNIDIKISKE